MKNIKKQHNLKTILKKELGPPMNTMNADKSFVFNPRLSAFIGGHQFGRLFQQALKPLPPLFAWWHRIQPVLVYDFFKASRARPSEPVLSTYQLRTGRKRGATGPFLKCDLPC